MTGQAPLQQFRRPLRLHSCLLGSQIRSYAGCTNRSTDRDHQGEGQGSAPGRGQLRLQAGSPAILLFLVGTYGFQPLGSFLCGLPGPAQLRLCLCALRLRACTQPKLRPQHHSNAFSHLTSALLPSWPLLQLHLPPALTTACPSTKGAADQSMQHHRRPASLKACRLCCRWCSKQQPQPHAHARARVNMGSSAGPCPHMRHARLRTCSACSCTRTCCALSRVVSARFTALPSSSFTLDARARQHHTDQSPSIFQPRPLLLEHPCPPPAPPSATHRPG
jgi:hypothetical protein